MYHSELSEPVHRSHTSQLDRTTLEEIRVVVRRTLSSRFRTLAADAVADAVQEAMCKFFEHGALRTEINARTVYSWILTASTRELAHLLRYQGRFAISKDAPNRPTEPPGSHHHTDAHDAVPTDHASPQMDHLTYHTLLGHLSSSLAEAARLHFEGYTAAEIATLTGCTEAAAYKRVQRACSELRRLWSEEEHRLGRLLAIPTFGAIDALEFESTGEYSVHD